MLTSVNQPTLNLKNPPYSSNMRTVPDEDKDKINQDLIEKFHILFSDNLDNDQYQMLTVLIVGSLCAKFF